MISHHSKWLSLASLILLAFFYSPTYGFQGGPGGPGGGGGGLCPPGCEAIITNNGGAQEICCECPGMGDPCNPDPTDPGNPGGTPGGCTFGTGPMGWFISSGGGGASCPINDGEANGATGGIPHCPPVGQVVTPLIFGDLQTMYSLGGGSGGSGCAGCGSSGGGDQGTAMPSIAFTRRAVLSNQVELFSFGRGMPSDYDFRLTLYPLSNADPVALMYDPKNRHTFYLEDTGANGSYDFDDNIHFSSIELVDGSGNSVGDPSQAANSDVFANVTRRNGWVYKLKVCATPMEGGEYISRLESITNPQGESIGFTYKTFTQTEIDSSPSRQLQIDTVTDGYNNVSTVSYAAQQQSGQWVISEINLNTGEAVVDYSYDSNGLLSSVARGTEVVSTYSYGMDSFYNMATVTTSDRGNYSHSRNDVLLLSPDYQNGDGSVVNQYANIIQGVRNGSGQVKYMVYADPNNEGWYKIKYEDQMIEYKWGESVRWYEQYTQSGSGYAGITGTLESSWGHHPGITATQLRTLQPPTTVDATGYTVTNTFDTNGNLIRVDHPDSTYEKWLYDTNNQVTYYRDRAGFVEVTERDSNHRVVRVARGLTDNSGSGNPTATTEAVQDIKGYYGTGHANEGRLAWSATTAYTTSITAPPANERTDYEYDANQRLIKTILPLPNGQTARPEITYAWTGNYKTSETDPLGHTTTFSYDFMGRQIETLYSDGTNEQTFYDDVNSAVYRKNRVDVVSQTMYGPSGRMTTQIAAYGNDADLSDGQVDTVNGTQEHSLTSYVYAPGVTTPVQTITDGKIAVSGFDYRGRNISQTQYPSSRSTLATLTSYVNNQKFTVTNRVTDTASTQDHDIVNYYGYSANGQTVRTIQTRKPGVTFADNSAVLNATRVGGEDPDYIVNDAVRDIRGQIVQLIDPMDMETLTTYDALGRSTLTTRTGGSLSLSSQQSYDEDGNVTQQVSEAGMVTDMTYDPAGNLTTRTEAPGTSIAATWTYTYTLDGRQETVTSPLGAVSTTIYETCCGFTVGRKNALGHGSVSSANSAGQSVHSATLEDYDTHSNLLNPTDNKTLSESTSKYDDLGRARYRTRWVTPRGVIDRNDPPIAGIGGVASADGLTIEMLYDSKVGDIAGLDSPGGVAVNLFSGGSANVSIASVVTKLADTVANGGAALSFDNANHILGSATVSISADQKTMQVSVSDGAGRGIFSGQMWGPASSTPNTLINWSCTILDRHDATTASIATLKTSTVDIDGNQTHLLADGYGRSIISIDQLGNKSEQKYDAGGKLLRSINALSHETAYAYDDLGRQTTVTDPLSHTRTTAYDATTGRVSSQTDAKGNSSSNTYDARGRVTASIDRLSKTTSKTYDLEGRQLTITDAENRQTTYVYNLLGQRTATTLADGSSRGMTYDAAGRLTRTDYPSGKSKTNVYSNGATDIAGVVRTIEYRESGNTLVGSDTFSFDTLLRRTGSSSRYGVSQAMAYNDRGQMSSESTTYGGQTYTVSYERDDRGRTTKTTYPSGTYVEYDYTDRGLLDLIKVDGIQIEDRDYSVLGQLTSIDRPTIDETRTYDNRGQVTTIGNGAVGTATYTYDANGNKLSESWSGAMNAWNFTTHSGGNDGYDAEDRFLNFNQPNQSKTLSMTRSDIGNITNVTLNGTGTTRGYSNVHELTSVGGSSQTFDTDGNQSTSTSGNSYQWDEGGMLKQVTALGSTIEYGYGADGKRIWKKVTDGGNVTETVYVHSGPNRIAEYAKGTAPASNSNEHVYAGGIDSLVALIRSGVRYSITRNQQWSVSALVDSSGNIAERYTYDEFGKRTILATNGSTVRTSSDYAMDFGYTSRSHEIESGLMCFRARYFDPSTGEFISRDPLEYVDGMSQYRAFIGLSSRDPSGTEIEECYDPESVVNHPWSYDELDDGELGNTDYDRDVLFSCKCKQSGYMVHTHEHVYCGKKVTSMHTHKTWKQDCKAKLKTIIKITERYRYRNPLPKRDRNTGEIVEEWKRHVYGHEQIHVLGLRQEFGIIIERMEKAGACSRSFISEAACKKDCILLDNELSMAMFRYANREAQHDGHYWPFYEGAKGYPVPNIEPWGGEGKFPEAENENEG